MAIDGSLIWRGVRFRHWSRDESVVNEILYSVTKALASLSRVTGCLVVDAEGIWVVGRWRILWRWGWLKWFEETSHEKLFIDRGQRRRELGKFSSSALRAVDLDCSCGWFGFAGGVGCEIGVDNCGVGDGVCIVVGKWCVGLLGVDLFAFWNEVILFDVPMVHLYRFESFHDRFL